MTDGVRDTPGTLLEHRATVDRDKAALLFPAHGTRLTFGEWDDVSAALARALLDLGLVRGDRIALLSENRVEWPIVHLGVARAGLILVPINTHSRSEDLEHVLAQSGSRVVFLPEAFRSNPYLRLLDAVRERLPALEYTVIIGSASGADPWLALDELVDRGRRSETVLPPVAGEDPSVILYTSGTTGRPKGVILKHSGVMANGRGVFERLSIVNSDVVSSTVPMFHSGAFCTAMPGCLAVGATYVGVDSFDAVQMMEIIQAHRATVHTAVPATLRAMLNHPRRSEFDLSSLRAGTIGGADADAELIKAVRSEFPFPELVECYGLTEAAALVTCAAPDSDPGTAGLPLPGYEVRVAAVDTDNVLGVGQIGEVQVKSNHNMIGYFRLPEATAETFTADGWLKSGDLGELTADGELRMTGGRLKDMIIRGGENIYPAEIESVLARHPAVAEVAVFGIPDLALGEVVAAAVATSREVTASELSAFCAQRIARFKVPAVYFRVEEWPLTSSGKIRKTVLREEAARDGLPLMSLNTADA